MPLQDKVKRLPYPLLQPIKYLYGAVPSSVRLGRVFWDTYDFLRDSEAWDRTRLEEYQMNQLVRLLAQAKATVPYYGRLFAEYGFDPHDLSSLTDLSRIPVLEKDTVRTAGTEMLSTAVSRRGLRVSHTSGTTGKPLQFWEDPSVSQKEMAFIFHQWARVDYKPGEPRVELRGPVIRGGSEYNPHLRVLRLSPAIHGKETTVSHLEKMRTFGARFLHGYPSAIASFAFSIKQQGLKVPFNLRAVLFASEAVYTWEREVVQEAFNCRVFSHYGCAEKVILAAECEESVSYHCLPQYGVTEFEPDTGAIIATGFVNTVFPFIRYKLTDRVSLPTKDGCHECGRSYFPVFERVEGRLEDFLIAADGTPISPAIVTHPFKDLKSVRETQIIQDDIDRIVLRATLWPDANTDLVKQELQYLQKALKAIVGCSNVAVEIVDTLPKEASGKFRWIISNISSDMLQKGLK